MGACCSAAGGPTHGASAAGSGGSGRSGGGNGGGILRAGPQMHSVVAGGGGGNGGGGGSGGPSGRGGPAGRRGSGGGGGGSFDDLSSLSTRSRRSLDLKLETVTEEQGGVGGVGGGMGGSPLDARHMLAAKGDQRGANGSSLPLRNEYQHAHSSLTHGGSAALLNEQVRMDAALLSIPFFDALDLKHVKILRSFFTRRVYAPKEVVLAEGLPLGQQVFHIIISGRVEMCAKDAYGKRTVLQQFGPGEWFGEMTWNASQDQIQPVTVYALQRTTILYTSSHQFAAALEQFPQLSVAINVNPDCTAGLPSSDASATADDPHGVAAARAASLGPRSLGIGAPIQVQLRRIPFFADVEELKLQQLAMLCEIRKKKAGTWICVQGADADGFYYILRGRVEVSARGFEQEQLLTQSAADAKPAGAFPTSRPAAHRGSGNGGTQQPNHRLDDSPLFGGRRRINNEPGTPLTPGFTPSPPSTPQRSQPPQGSRMSPAAGPGHGVGAREVRRGASFSGSSAGGGNGELGGAGPGEDSKDSSPLHSPTQPSVHLATLSADNFFGEIALLEKTTRTASVRATQDCILLYLSRERFVRFLKFAPSIRSSAMFTELIRKRTANSLKCLPIFAPLRTKTVGSYQAFDEKRLALLSAMFVWLSVPANTTVFAEGDYGMAFYIVVAGECVVTAKSPHNDDEEIKLNELHANDFFGESSLIHKMRCNATVKTKTACLLLKLNGENFQQFLAVVPEVESLFRQRVNVRTSERLRSIPFFRNVRENKPFCKLDLLGALFTFEEFTSGETVFHQGTAGGKFYIIVNGEVEISVVKDRGEGGESRHVLDVLTNQSWFGEISLLRRTARTASARCVSPNGAVLLSLDSVRFQKFLRIAPELSEDFSSLLIHRTSNLLRSFDLFKQVQENKPWSKMEMIASLFEYELAEAGQLIYAPGDAADRFYVIASGCVRIESRWAGMQTLHSQAAFGAMEIMKNWQNDKAHKAEMARWERRQLQRQQAEAEERKRNPDFAAAPATAAAAVAPPTPPSPLFRTHTARAVELCGLMWMSLPSFRSLLTLAPEILPYFAAIAEHGHRRIHEMEGDGEFASTPTFSTAGAQAPAAPLTPLSPLAPLATSSSSPSAGDSASLHAAHRGSMSALVLPPSSAPPPGANQAPGAERTLRAANSADASPHLSAAPPTPLAPASPAGLSLRSPAAIAEEASLDDRARQLGALLARMPSSGARDLTDLSVMPASPVLIASRPPAAADGLPEVDLAASSQARRKTPHTSPQLQLTRIRIKPLSPRAEPAPIDAPATAAPAHAAAAAPSVAPPPPAAPSAPAAWSCADDDDDDEESAKARLLASLFTAPAPAAIEQPQPCSAALALAPASASSAPCPRAGGVDLAATGSVVPFCPLGDAHAAVAAPAAVAPVASRPIRRRIVVTMPPRTRA